MATVDDWSDLVTVNYIAGYGGEFFSFLLYESFHGEIEYIHHEKKYRYDFSFLDPFGTTPLYKFNSLTHEIKTNYSNTYPIFYWDNKKQIDIDKIKNIYYVEDRKEYLLNLRYYFLDNYIPKYKQNNITKIHNIIDNENSIYIQEVFPKSKNYNLICKNKSEHFIFRLLAFYKIFKDVCIFKNKNKIISKQTAVSFTLNYFVDSIFFNNFKSKEKGIEINVFDLFIKQEYDKYDLNFNKKKLNLYREEIFSILNIFEIDPFKSYTKEETYQLIEKYFNNGYS